MRGVEHRFGGDWTERKLDRLRKYLAAYAKIFSTNPRASVFRTTYLDAFAGTGHRERSSATDDLAQPLFGDPDAQAFQNGSARIALETQPPFDKYVFIEQRADFARELESLKADFPGLADRIDIRQGEANAGLQTWVTKTDWSRNRTVVFLDPYGMDVEWRTLEALAGTKAVDLWVLFPLGQAVSRLLTRKGPPEEAWARKLTRFFGTDTWLEAFYKSSPQMSFLEDDRLERDADFAAIGTFFLERLRGIFAGVAPNTLALKNSKGIPIYLLCFAAANPKGSTTAVRIAQHLLR